jgi:single-strand DNA-binding protein
MSNTWIGDGRLTRDPELRHTNSGNEVTAMRLAVDRPGDPDGTDFFDVVAFGTLAANTAKYLAKGRHVLVEGSLRQQTWTDRDSGEKRGRVEIVARRVSFLDGPRRDVETPEDAA